MKMSQYFSFIKKRREADELSPLIFKEGRRDNGGMEPASCGRCPPADGAETGSGLGTERQEELAHLYHRHHAVTKVNVYIKYTMIVFNFMFTVLGSLILGIGIWGLIDKESLDVDNINNLSTDPMLAFVVVGLLVGSMSFSGCVGALRENQCLLKFFTAGILILLTVQVVGGIAVYFLRDRLEQYVENGMILGVKRYQDDLDLRFIINEIQRGLECCGVESYHDWELNLYFNCSSPGIHACGAPASCCINPQENGTVMNSQCGFGTLHMEEVTAQNYIYLRGCMPHLTSWLTKHAGSITALGVILMIVQVLGLIFAKKILSDIELIKAHWKRRDRNAIRLPTTEGETR
ncbi:tetraspanin-10 [Amblyraja radiata]|uniref:tetraspanin-10 n=1 Tax=Amblyraja radiata TaxID=386614 RepID=UPI00140412B3|nr:tetraspanin-10 [Amblyraja radiata]